MRALARAAGVAALCLSGVAIAASPFPVEIQADFDLVDQTGARVTDESLRGQPLMLFFGYANCESICDVALPMMGEAVALLGPDADQVLPVMITIDPERDTPEALQRAMPRYHERMVGLTGSEEALAAARAEFQVEVTVVAEDAAGDPIFAHGGFIYLIDGDGQVKTLLPPILSPERVAELVRKHLITADPA